MSTLIQTDRFVLSETERSAIEHEMHHYEDPRAASIEALKPSPIDSTPTNTATTPATPKTVEIEAPRRSPIVRRFMPATATAWDRTLLISDSPQRVDDAQAHGLERRHRLPVGAVAATIGAPPPEPAAPPEPEPHDDQPWHLVREKEHPADPMTVDDALFQMELVGHDFYLFLDKESGRPSVVYRRRGYDYGLMSLAAPA